MRPEEPVARIMTETVVVIDVDRPVSEALDCFRQYGIHHLPVVRGGRIAGMLSSYDVPRLARHETRAVPGPADPDDAITIPRLMHAPVTALRPGDTIAHAVGRMIEAGVHAAPVVDDAGQVLGIVTTTDVMQGLLRGPPRRLDSGGPDADPPPPSAGDPEQVHYHRRPTDDELALAIGTAQALHVETRDPRYLGKTLLYLEQRNAFLERVFELADRFLLSGQDVQVHSLLLKAIHAAKRAEEHATGRARVPFPLE
ncbi:MAG: CBS domain-containing protein [Steroidobacteraceae bacterium]